MTGIAGLRILIVEDEALIAMMAEDMITELGCIVAGTAASIAEAQAALATLAFDAAVLDVNLNGDNSMGLAAALKDRGCPFAFTTGYGADGIEPAHRDMPVLTKPYAIADLEAALSLCAQKRQVAGVSSMTSSNDSKRG